MDAIPKKKETYLFSCDVYLKLKTTRPLREWEIQLLFNSWTFKLHSVNNGT